MPRTRILAAYLGALAVGQLGLYVRWVAKPDSLCFYLDPRIGLFVLETMLVGHEPVGPARLGWAATLGGPSHVMYITTSGREVPAATVEDLR